VAGAVVIIKDINDIKRMQDSIRKARDEWAETFNVINDAITIHDDKYTIIQANKAAKKLLGISLHEVGMRKCYEAYHGVDRPPALCGTCQTQLTGAPSVTEVFEPHLNRYLETKALPRSDRNGRFLGTVHIVRDITDRKKAEEEQRSLQAELLQIQKMDSIGRLAGAIAHDFNNILSAIIGFSKLALTKVSNNDPVAEDLRIIGESGERAAALTKQLLAFSRKQVLEMKVVNLNTVIENTVKMIGRLIGTQVILDLRLHKPLGNVVADVGQLEQILMNLLVNARDAMPSGGTITIETAETGAPEGHEQEFGKGPFIMLTVTDTGMGMSPEVKERIFEPFFTTKDQGKGTGLGLSTVYGIVKQHNGHVVVRSEPGEGTTFELYFPLVDRDVEKIIEHTQSVPACGTETVLVVDDEPTILKLVTNTLLPRGYKLLEASSGEEALKAVDAFSGSIDLLITDVVMPGINGSQLADRFRELRPALKVIFMTGYAGDALVSRGDSDPETVLIQKPLTPAVLAEKVREVLDRNGPGSTRTFEKQCGIVRILYADDDVANRLLVKKYLDGISCTLDLCENGQVAVERYTRGGYDLVFMDMQMPMMDGRSASWAIRTWEQKNGSRPTPIIALTGFASDKEIQACLDAGCTAHLTKPFTRKALLSAVNAYAPGPFRPIGATKHIDVRVDKDLQDLIPGYLQNRRADVENLRRAAEECDYGTIRILGHTLKGSGGGYGFDAITDIGKNLETAANNHDPVECGKMISELSNYLDRIRVTYE
jgi:PAS domain S-box-containing protein